MPAGQVVPAFEVLDATHKKVIDGAHTWAGYWVGKNKAAILFTGGPGGPFGMDHMDYLSWMWHGGGLEMYNKFYQETLKLNVVAFPILSTSPQALGWFKKQIESLADFKGQKCRQTGIAAEIMNEMGMRTVNMPGGEIMPAAERGTIDCAEWVGGIEDLRFGFHTHLEVPLRAVAARVGVDRRVADQQGRLGQPRQDSTRRSSRRPSPSSCSCGGPSGSARTPRRWSRCATSTRSTWAPRRSRSTRSS